MIMRAAAGNLKRVSLELGGKSPNIVFADADLEQAAVGAASAIYFNHGQCCCAGSRLFIEQKAYDKVMPQLIEYSEKIKLGPGMDPADRDGPAGLERAVRARHRLPRRRHAGGRQGRRRRRPPEAVRARATSSRRPCSPTCSPT